MEEYEEEIPIIEEAKDILEDYLEKQSWSKPKTIKEAIEESLNERRSMYGYDWNIEDNY